MSRTSELVGQGRTLDIPVGKRVRIDRQTSREPMGRGAGRGLAKRGRGKRQNHGNGPRNTTCGMTIISGSHRGKGNEEDQKSHGGKK
jgi:hypothetical protein